MSVFSPATFTDSRTSPRAGSSVSEVVWYVGVVPPVTSFFTVMPVGSPVAGL